MPKCYSYNISSFTFGGWGTLFGGYKTYSHMILPNSTQPLTKFITYCTYLHTILYLNFICNFTASAVPQTLHLTMSPSVTEIQVENHVFPATAKPPATCHSFFLAGAGMLSRCIHNLYLYRMFIRLLPSIRKIFI